MVIHTFTNSVYGVRSEVFVNGAAKIVVRLIDTDADEVVGPVRIYPGNAEAAAVAYAKSLVGED